MSYQKGVVVYYRALVSEKEFQKEEAQLFKNTIFGGSFSKLLSAFAESENLTKEEADQIKEWVDGNRKNC